MRGIRQYCMLESKRSVLPEGKVVEFHQLVLRGKQGLKNISKDSELHVGRCFSLLQQGSFEGKILGGMTGLFHSGEKSLVRMLLAVVTLDK